MDAAGVMNDTWNAPPTAVIETPSAPTFTVWNICPIEYVIVVLLRAVTRDWISALTAASGRLLATSTGERRTPFHPPLDDTMEVTQEIVRDPVRLSILLGLEMTVIVVPESAVVPDPPSPIETAPVLVTVPPVRGTMVGVIKVPVAILVLP